MSVTEAQLQCIFKMMDTDGNGLISHAEMKAATVGHGVLTFMKLSDSDFDAIFKAADVNGDGEINYEEFVAFAPKLAGTLHMEGN